MKKIKKVLILLLIVAFFSQSFGFCASNRDFGLRPPMYFNKLMQEALDEKSAQELNEEEILVDKEIEFGEAEVRDRTAFDRKVLKLFGKIDIEDWPSPPVSSPESDVAIALIAELSQRSLLSGDTRKFGFIEKHGNGKGGYEVRWVAVDSQEYLDRLRNSTRETGFDKIVGEMLNNAYNTCVRRMLGNPNDAGGRIETGKIRLVLAIREKNLIIRIIDNGEGIKGYYGSTPNFNMHYGNDYENLLVGGQGIGIPLVQTLMKYHGGTVEWRGPSGYPEGFGTEVVMTFPVDNELFKREHPDLFPKPRYKEASEGEVLVDKKIEFGEAEVRDDTAFSRKVLKLLDKIDIEDWPSPPVSSPEAEAAIYRIAELKQRKFLDGGTSSFQIRKKNDNGGYTVRQIDVDSQEYLDRLRNSTMETGFRTILYETLNNAYDTCVRRMLGYLVGDPYGGTNIKAGKIRLVVTLIEKKLVIRIIDNGEGFTGYYGTMPRFNKYHAKDCETLLKGGAGIGVPLVQTLMKYHGGTVEWRGPSGYPEGFGTEVVMTFPVDNELFKREHPNLFPKPHYFYTGAFRHFI